MLSAPLNILDQFRLDGKVALVTGSASGIGAAIAVALAQAGATVACHGNRRAANETAAVLGGDSAAFRADLSSTTGAEDLFSQVKEKFGRVDILINNAGTILRGAAEEVRLEDWQEVLQVNLTSVFQLSQLAARDMIPRGGLGSNCGKIVNIASLLSFQGGIRVPAYAASKGGVAQLTKALANEWAPKGIQVNAIAPGYFATTKSSNAFRQLAGASRRTLQELRSFSAPPLATTLRASCSRSMGDGWAGERVSASNGVRRKKNATECTRSSCRVPQ